MTTKNYGIFLINKKKLDYKWINEPKRENLFLCLKRARVLVSKLP